MKISKSKYCSDEVCASIVRIGEIEAINGADRIVKTSVFNKSIIIRRDEFNEGDVAVFIPGNTILSKEFASKCSLYKNNSLNNDCTVSRFVEDSGLVRIIRLKGVCTNGILVSVDQLSLYVWESKQDVKKFLIAHIGFDFDTINDNIIINSPYPIDMNNKSNDALALMNENKPLLLNKHIYRIKSNDRITIRDTNKGINILVYKPKNTNKFKINKFINKLLNKKSIDTKYVSLNNEDISHADEFIRGFIENVDKIIDYNTYMYCTLKGLGDNYIDNDSFVHKNTFDGRKIKYLDLSINRVVQNNVELTWSERLEIKNKIAGRCFNVYAPALIVFDDSFDSLLSLINAKFRFDIVNELNKYFHSEKLEITRISNSKYKCTRDTFILYNDNFLIRESKRLNKLYNFNVK